MRDVGLHLQIQDSLVALADQATELQLKIFQCFLAQKTVGQMIPFAQQDIEDFVGLHRKQFDNLYMHSSYWVNLADTKRMYHPLLQQELDLAQKLEFTHVVLHCGSARGARNKDDALDALARMVDKLLSHPHELTILLENTAHGGKAIGSDLRDFKALLKRLDHPERLRFCVDTGHAYLFGYDIATDTGREEFINRVDDIMGWENVELLHLNDSQEACGSKIDHHYTVGQGSIGDAAIKNFVLHPKVADIPIIMEVPMLSEEEQKKLLEKVRSWHTL